LQLTTARKSKDNGSEWFFQIGDLPNPNLVAKANAFIRAAYGVHYRN